MWAETLGINADRKRVNVREIKCLRIMVGVTRMDRVWNDVIHRRSGLESELAGIVDQRAFGQVETKDEYRMGKGVAARVNAARVRGRRRSKGRLVNIVTVALGGRGMKVEAARRFANDCKECGALDHMSVNEIDAATLLGSCVIWIVFPSSTGLPPGGRAECYYVMRLRETEMGLTSKDKAHLLGKCAKGLM